MSGEATTDTPRDAPTGDAALAEARAAYRAIGDAVRGRWYDGPDEEDSEIRKFMRTHVPALLGIEPDPDVGRP